VRRVAPHSVKGRLSVSRLRHVIALQGQHLPKEGADQRFVVNDEDPCRDGGGPAGGSSVRWVSPQHSVSVSLPRASPQGQKSRRFLPPVIGHPIGPSPLSPGVPVCSRRHRPRRPGRHLPRGPAGGRRPGAPGAPMPCGLGAQTTGRADAGSSSAVINCFAPHRPNASGAVVGRKG
jgi:hypothetical protein